MAGEAISLEALLHGLADIRLPEAAPGGFWGEALAAAGLGLGLSVLVGLAVRAVTARRGEGVVSDAPDMPLDHDSQRRALLARLRTERPEAYARYRETLYRKGGLPDIAELETALAGGGGRA